MSLSVIIPSRTMENVVPCVEAVRRHNPGCRIFVIDDGLADRSLVDAITIDGAKPFIFARNCNIGIIAAGPDDDVILLNDDALLETPGGFDAMQAHALAPDYGLISATTNMAGNAAQYRVSAVGIDNKPVARGVRWCRTTPGNSVPVVAFVCVLIPRRTIQAIGLLDQRFDKYGYEDNDYCRRVHNAGLVIGICDGCFVDHKKLKSTFRGNPEMPGQIEAGRKIYLEKWGSM